MKNKKVVITGGAGFIGSSLAHELADDNTVIIIDDLSTGKRANISELTNRENVSFMQASILNHDLLHDACRNADFVFHQAAIASVPRSIEDPSSTNEVNITGTLNVLMAARDNGVKKVVFASSSAIYGNNPTLPKKESMTPEPQSPYAITKLAGEYYGDIFHHLYGLPTVSLRYFNIYGPRQDPHSQYAAVIPYFISQIQQGQPPVIYGDGEQTRDFTFVRDVVRANIAAAESAATGILNIGAGGSITINKLAAMLTEVMGRDLKPVHQAPRPGDIRNSLADISRARAMGYQPKYCLEDGLRETVQWFLDQH